MGKTLAATLALVIPLLLCARDARADGDAAKGGKLLVKKGCISCHSTDGSPRSGPSFRGLYGANRTVITDGATHELLADDAYLARAMREPDTDVVVGFPRGTMPKFELSDDDIASITRSIEVLASVPAPGAAPESSPRSGSAMAYLAFFSAFFVGLHLLLSRVGVRKRLIATLSQLGFSIVYSVIATIGLVGMIVAFRSAPYVEVWLAPRAMRWVPVLVMPMVSLLLVAGFSTKSATTVGQGALATQEDAARGIITITRHPALWGFALWGLSHLATNGELRAIIIFVAIVTLSFAGMVHIDRRRAVELGDGWTTFAERASLMPFGAILRRKATLDLRGIGIVRVLAAAFLYVGALHMHAMLIGASPMP